MRKGKKRRKRRMRNSRRKRMKVAVGRLREECRFREERRGKGGDGEGKWKGE